MSEKNDLLIGPRKKETQTFRADTEFSIYFYSLNDKFIKRFHFHILE